MIYLFTFIHVVACLVLILVVLLQQGKGADWAGAFGGGGSQTVFGPRGASNLLTKATTAAAIIFMLTSLALTIMLSRPGSSSVIREGATPSSPAAPISSSTTPGTETGTQSGTQAPAPPPEAGKEKGKE